jgi:hypothetical protein
MFLGGLFYLHVGCVTVRECSGAHDITRETARAGRIPSIGTERVPYKRVGGDFLLSQTPTFPNNLSASGRYDYILPSPKMHMFVECVFVSEWKPAETCLSICCLLLFGFGPVPS